MTGESQSSRQPRRVVRGVLLLLAAAALVAGLTTIGIVPPAELRFWPSCQFHTLTGLHCPGCGTTRALHALLNGRIAQAFAFNAMAFLVLPVLGWSLVCSLRDWQRGAATPPSGISRNPSFLPLVLLAVLLLFTVLRNIPSYPFTLLAPHKL